MARLAGSGGCRASGLLRPASRGAARPVVRALYKPHDGGAPAPALRAPPPAAAATAALAQPAVSLLERAPAGPSVARGRPPATKQAGAPAAAPRLRVAVDVDEVLGRFVHALNGYCKDEYGWDYSVADYHVYEYAKVWGCSQHRSTHIVHSFFQSPHFTSGIPPVPGAAEALGRLGAWCDLAVVTSRQHVIQDATLDWLDAHYPGTFPEVFFGNHWALEGSSRSKSDICASIGAHVLVDDNVGYARECAAAGIRVLLFDWEGSYPWSKLPPGSEDPNITVVHSWEEAEAALQAMAPAAPWSAGGAQQQRWQAAGAA